METIGDRILKLRNEQNKTQKEISSKVGITEVTLSRYENNLREPKGEIITKLAKALNSSPDYLLGHKTDTNHKLSKKDEQDIAKDLEETMNKLRNQKGLMFDGSPASEETLKALEEALEMGMRYAKAVNKKYIPKKYRKNEK